MVRKFSRLIATLCVRFELSMKSDLKNNLRTFHEIFSFLLLKFMNWSFRVLWLKAIKKKLVNNSLFRHDFSVQMARNRNCSSSIQVSLLVATGKLLYFLRYHRSSALNFLRSQLNWRSRKSQLVMLYSLWQRKGNSNYSCTSRSHSDDYQKGCITSINQHVSPFITRLKSSCFSLLSPQATIPQA